MDDRGGGEEWESDEKERSDGKLIRKKLSVVKIDSDIELADDV